MRIISKFAFDRMCENFAEHILEIEIVNDYFVRIVLETAEIVEYVLYSELKEIKNKEKPNEGNNWIKTPQEDIDNPWLYEEINIIDDIFLAKLKDETSKCYVICYKDIVVGEIFEETNNIDIRICSYKPSGKSYIIQISVDGKSKNSIFHQLPSEEDAMRWIESPWYIDIFDVEICN